MVKNGIPEKFVGIAPGTVWNTKRWPAEHFSRLTQLFGDAGVHVVAVGGEADRTLCEGLRTQVRTGGYATAAGELSLLESAELIRRSSLLVANDSAPMHIALAMGTPVIAIYGATVPGFGFAPYGPSDVVVETMGLTCRPCTKHGGDRCPIETFVCMKEIAAERVYAIAERMLEARTERSTKPPASRDLQKP
jgi:heptosyltransferase-2